MTAIKTIIDGQGVQYYPQTHTRAVVDDNGYTVESRITDIEKFKGWFGSYSSLASSISSPGIGDYAYVSGATVSDTVKVYICSTSGIWSDSGNTVDVSNVQTFETGEEVNDTSIIDELITGGVADVLSAEQGKIINGVLNITPVKITDNGSSLARWDCYINTSGELASSTTTITTEPFLLSSGCTVTVTTDTNNAAIISETDRTASSYTPLVTNTTSGSRTYTYTATEDMYISVCRKRTGSSMEYEILHQDNAIESLDSRLSAVEEEVTQPEIQWMKNSSQKLVFTSGGATYNYSGSSLKWRCARIDVSKYVGEKIYLKCYCPSGSAYCGLEKSNGSVITYFNLGSNGTPGERYIFISDLMKYLFVSVVVEDANDNVVDYSLKAIINRNNDISERLGIIERTINDIVYPEVTKDTSITASTGEVGSSSSGYYSSDYVAIDGFAEIEMPVFTRKAGSSTTVGYAFYDSEHTFIEGVLAESVGDGKDEYIVKVLPITNGATYIRATVLSPLGNGAFYVKRRTSSSVSMVEAKYTWEESCAKRAAILRDTKWKPLLAVPGTSSSTGFSANTTYTGIPYSSTRQIDKYVGYDVSLYTFMTALHNSASLIYTEDINGNRSRSSWGNTYYADECGSYMGMQCATFVCYVLGIETYWLTHQTRHAASMGIFSYLGQPSAQNMKLFDVIKPSGHYRIVTGITYDENGIITDIELSDAWKDLPRKISYTASSFNSNFRDSSYAHYRLKDEYKSTYVGDDAEITYNDDICTYAGDKATFRVGERIVIDYTIGDYTSMQVYKDESLLQTIQLEAGSAYVDLSSYNFGYGKYKARLTDGTNHSDYTYFEILETTVSATNANGMQTVEFFSRNAEPLYVEFVHQDGDSVIRYMLSREDKNRLYTTFNAEKINLAQSRYTLGSTTHVKVSFKGAYGRVTNEPIILDLS